MGKLIKLLLGLTLLLALIVVVSVVGTLVFFDPNEHKDFIIAKVEKETGRKLALTGDISLTYYPWLGLEAEGITLGNSKGFGDAPFLHADRVALRIKTMPLLNQHYELDTLKLQGLQLNLAKNKEGITNWADLGANKDESAQQKPLPLSAVVLGGVDIRDGRIIWQDGVKDQTINISGLTVSTGELTYGAPINLAVVFKAESNKPALNSDVKLNGVLNYNLDTEIYAFKPIDLAAKLTGKDVPGGAADLLFKAAVESNLKEDTANISDLSLDVLGTSIKGALTAAKVSSGTPEVKAQLTIKGEDLTKLLQLIDPKVAGELARLDDRSVDVKLSLSADLGQDNLRVSDLDVKMLGAVIHGQVEANHFLSQTPSAKGNLKATGPDLPALLQVIGQFETGENPKLEDYGKRLAKVADKSFDITAEFDTDLSSGNIQIPTLSAKTLGITLQGKLAAQEINSSSGKVDGKFTLHGEKLAEVLTALDQKALGEVLQVLDINTEVSGAGKDIVLSPLAVKATFAGKQIPNSPADVALNADTRINLEKQTLVMNNLTLQGLGLNVAGNINASKILGETPALNGKIDAKGNDLALLFKVAGIEPLAGQLAALDNRSFDIKAGVDADPGAGNVKLSNLDAKLLGATINGDIDASNIQSKTPAARGKLKATGPDLPALLQVLGQFETGKEPKLKEYGQRLAKVTDKSFDVSAEFDADLKAGNIRVPTLAVKTLGITVNGQLDAQNMNSNSGKVNGKLSLQGDKLAGVLAAFGQAGLGEVMQSVAVDAGVSGTGGDITLSPLQVKATFAGKQIPNSPVDVTLNGNTRANLEQQTLTVSNLTIKGLGLNVLSNINATQILGQPGFSGDLAVAEFNLRKLAQQLNQTLPETADKNALNKVALKTGFSGNTDSLSLKDLAIHLDETKLNGNLSVAHFTQPDIQFGIGIDSINADRYLPPAKGKPDKPVTPETAAGGAATELPLETLRSLKINGDLQIGQLVLSNARMNNVKLSIRAKEGDIRLDPVAADLYGGKYQGVVTLDAKGKVPQLQLSSQLNGVQLEPLLKDYSQKPESPLAGIANISAANLSAKGSDAGQLKQSLTGQAKFQVEKGVLKGIDVRKTLEAAEVLLESKQLGTVKQGGETAFDQLSGTLDINNGVVMNKDLLMKAPGFQVTGDGMLANLHDNTIKYNLQVGVEESRTSRGEKQYNLGGYKIPIKCRGKLNAIESACQPDLEGLAAVALKKGIQEKIEEQLGEKLGIKLPGMKPTQKITPQQLSTPLPQSTQEKVVAPAPLEKQSQETVPQKAIPQETPAQETAPTQEIQPAESEPKDQTPQEAIPLQEPQQQEAPLTESQQQTTQEQKAAPTQQQPTTEPQSTTQEQTTTQQQSATTENQEEKKQKTPEEQLKEGVEDLLKGL